MKKIKAILITTFTLLIILGGFSALQVQADNSTNNQIQALSTDNKALSALDFTKIINTEKSLGRTDGIEVLNGYANSLLTAYFSSGNAKANVEITPIDDKFIVTISNTELTSSVEVDSFIQNAEQLVKSSKENGQIQQLIFTSARKGNLKNNNITYVRDNNEAFVAVK